MSGRNQSNRKRNNKNSGGKQKKKKSQKLDPKAFWGDVDALPSPEGFAISTPDPVAVVNSLGPPPLPNHGAASPHYFKLVYGRATQLAGALAMAGEIDDLTPDPIPEPELEPEEDEENEEDEDEENETLDEEDIPLTEDAPAPIEASSDEEE